MCPTINEDTTIEDSKPKHPQRFRKKNKEISGISLGTMIKKITENEKEQRKIEMQARAGQYTAFSSLGDGSSKEKLKFSEISHIIDPIYKSMKPPLIPSTHIKESVSQEIMKSDPFCIDPSPNERNLIPITDQSENEALDSQFLTSK